MPLHFCLFNRFKFISIYSSMYDANAEYDWWRKLCISFHVFSFQCRQREHDVTRNAQFSIRVFFYVLIYPLKCLATTDDKNLYHLPFTASHTRHAVRIARGRLWMLLFSKVFCQQAITFVQCLQICRACETIANWFRSHCMSACRTTMQ